jgi:hypothetical protein
MEILSAIDPTLPIPPGPSAERMDAVESVNSKRITTNQRLDMYSSMNLVWRGIIQKLTRSTTYFIGVQMFRDRAATSALRVPATE